MASTLERLFRLALQIARLSFRLCANVCLQKIALHKMRLPRETRHFMGETVIVRFFCKQSSCAQKIFAERLPELCRPYAQRTTRLQEALCQLGLRVGGQAGADSGSDLGLSGSRDTILRLVRRWKQSAQSSPRVIGVDDWAHKRRLRYGTLICDLGG